MGLRSFSEELRVYSDVILVGPLKKFSVRPGVGFGYLVLDFPHLGPVHVGLFYGGGVVVVVYEDVTEGPSPGRRRPVNMDD